MQGRCLADALLRFSGGEQRQVFLQRLRRSAGAAPVGRDLQLVGKVEGLLAVRHVDLGVGPQHLEEGGGAALRVADDEEVRDAQGMGSPAVLSLRLEAERKWGLLRSRRAVVSK